jgi:hypothetical protein
VEPIHPDGLEIFAPPRVQEALGLPEWSRVGFGPTLPEQAVRVSFEAEWAQRLMRLIGGRGSYVSYAEAADQPPAQAEFLERELPRALVLENATFRLQDITSERSAYFLLVFRVTSTSDDKREDTLFLCINETAGATADRLIEPLLARLREDPGAAAAGPAQTVLPLALSGPGLGAIANRLLPARIRAKLVPFLAGMERRMARDLERLHSYYGDLRTETAARIETRRRKGEGAGGLEAEQARLLAIEREYHAKVADLDRKYAMSVDVRLAQAARATLPVTRAELFLLRRKGIRKLHMDWNPLARGFDLLPCEACFAAPKTYRVCDDRLHLVCPACLSACPACARESCKACHPAKCPRCGDARDKPGD